VPVYVVPPKLPVPDVGPETEYPGTPFHDHVNVGEESTVDEVEYVKLLPGDVEP